VGEMRNAYNILGGKQDLGVDGKIRVISERILEKQGGKWWTGFIWF
jgi:hypothetical protein